jgi:hypothetical protein
MVISDNQTKTVMGYVRFPCIHNKEPDFFQAATVFPPVHHVEVPFR